MKEINLSPKELKQIIDNSKLISTSGFSSAVFLYENTLIKLQKELYNYLKINDIRFADSIFADLYRWNKEPFVKEEQIKFLQDKQRDIKLTEFDEGIVKVNNQICGVILKNNLDYADLTNVEISDPVKILKILYNLLLALKELEDNRISHLDLANNQKGMPATINVLCKDTDVKLCDLSGDFITYEEKFNSNIMYQQYMNVIIFLLKKLEKLNPKFNGIVSSLAGKTISSYDEAIKTLADVSKYTENVNRHL